MGLVHQKRGLLLELAIELTRLMWRRIPEICSTVSGTRLRLIWLSTTSAFQCNLTGVHVYTSVASSGTDVYLEVYLDVGWSVVFLFGFGFGSCYWLAGGATYCSRL